uniref:helix-turn-helix domain-containing protein n=1 Tax=Pleionea sediminis TaxID=2569479 RepID=UPI001184F962
MSAKATFWAREVGRLLELTAAQRSVLRELADCHNQETGQCNPSVAHIAEYSGLNRKTVMAGIAELEQHRLISVVKRKGVRTNYKFNFLRYKISTSPKNGTTHFKASLQPADSKAKSSPENGT